MPITPITFTVLETTFLTGFGEWTYAVGGDTAKRTWTIQCSRQPTYLDIDAAAAALPVGRGDIYAADDHRYCQKVTIKANAGDFTGLYAEAEFGANQYEQNPLIRKDTISLEVAGEAESWFLDDDGKPTVTSAGEIFDKVPPRTTGGVKLVIEGNRSTLPAAAMVALTRPSATNSGSITVRGITLAEGQAKLIGCGGSEQTENGVMFYRVKWELALAPTWELDIDDRGFYEKVSGKQSRILRGEPREPVAKPWPLSSGVAVSDPSVAPDQIHFKPYPKSTFSFGWTAGS